ncbi:MAG TPA: IS66 family transposase [Gemmataceae bacterium]|nr:IS66 family transposase [Gemmataceae bacterium]
MQPQCPGCRERDARIARLEQQVADLTEQLLRMTERVRNLEARLAQNASNSSIPPSDNPPQAPPPVRKQPSGRQPGGQPGHAAHLRTRLPSERLTEPTMHYLPDICQVCQDDLPPMPTADDPEPRWHQVVELPAVPVQVTEYQAHARTCPNCGHVNWACIPLDIRNHVCGPRLTATLSYLSGVLHASRRGIEEFVETVLGVPIALGTVSNLEQEMSAALASAHAQAREAVQQAQAKNGDETGWKQAGQKRWLWGAATASVVCFVIAASRGAVGLAALLGKKIKGIISSDRWSVYGQLKLGLRQLCWAHLKRDFQKLVDRGGLAKEYGDLGLAAVPIMFHEWHLFRGGGGRAALQRELLPLREAMRSWLEEGARCEDSKAAALCGNLLAVEPALWTFLYKVSVETTNNHIERLLRAGVLWRKNAFGSHREEGCRFAERLLTVVQTLRLQKRPILEFLCQSVSAHRCGYQAPRLVLE